MAADRIGSTCGPTCSSSDDGKASAAAHSREAENRSSESVTASVDCSFAGNDAVGGAIAAVMWVDMSNLVSKPIKIYYFHFSILRI